MNPNTDTPPAAPQLPVPAPQHRALYGTTEELNPDDGGLSGISPRRLLRVALRNWWLLALGVALFGAAGWGYLTLVTPKFRAASLIEMSVRRPRITNERGPVSDDTDVNSILQLQVAEIFNTRLEKLKGKRMRELAAERIAAQTKLAPLSPEEMEDVLDDIKFDMVRKTWLIKITYANTNAQFACLVANAFAESVVQLSQEENRADSDNAVAWLETQVAKQRQTFEKIKQEVTAFRETKHMDAITNEMVTLQAAQADTGKQLTQIENAQILAVELLAAIRKVKLEPQNIGNLPDTTPRRDELLQAVSKWIAAIQDRDAELAKYTPEHPDVLARTKTIEMLKAQVAAAIERAQNTAEANVLLLQQQAEGLRQRMDTQARTAVDLENKIIRIQAEAGALEREQGVADTSYAGLLTRIEEAKLSADEYTAVVKIAEHAAPPTKPFAPLRFVILALGLLLGLAGGMGIALMVDLMEDRFMGTEDLEQTLGLRVLGLIPRLRGKGRAEIGRIAGTDRCGHAAEAYAGIRAVITASFVDHHAASLLITSSGPGEGKTITAANLAIAYANTRVKTLLVDFDLRRPQVCSVFNLPKGSPFLLDVLNEGREENFPRLPMPTDIPNLFVIGNHASREFSAAEIIGRPIISAFMAWARSEYDLVILDSPPLGVVSDALVLSGLTDGVVFVHRPGVSRRHALRGTVRQFSEAGAHLLGVIVNDVVFSRFFALSNYDYRYGGGDYTYDYPADKDRGRSRREKIKALQAEKQQGQIT
jgi:capsular exopolysaccharide synthesis family protein